METGKIKDEYEDWVGSRTETESENIIFISDRTD